MVRMREMDSSPSSDRSFLGFVLDQRRFEALLFSLHLHSIMAASCLEDWAFDGTIGHRLVSEVQSK
jgi:hypothetical protein